MKNFNILNGKLSDGVKPIYKNEQEFWKVFLTLLNTRTDNWITKKEIRVLSWILANDPTICYFSKPGSLQITEEINNLSFPELSRIKKKLLGHGMLTEKFVDGKVKTLLDDQILTLQKFVRDQGELNIVFPLSINEKPNQQTAG